MGVEVKRGRPRKAVTLEKLVCFRVADDVLTRIDAIHAAQEIETTQASVIRHLVLKGLEAVEKEAANV